MTAAASLSVVVASHGRPAMLRRCLLALEQCTHAPLEAIVVADKEGLEAISGLPFAPRLKTVLQAEPNLARARNDGIAQAAGDAVAFLDDDAVPEPTWAAALAGALGADGGPAAVTGPVLGRNGISLQWGPVAVDRQGRDRAISDADAPLPPGCARKLHGTNMAVRRDILLALGGFDPAFRFYLDDTDLALRLSQAGHRASWVPGAVVHHGFAASSRRDGDRVPLSLFDIGASTAIFLRKHAPEAQAEALGQLADDQRGRLFRLARRRKLGPREIERLMADLRAGIEDGRGRDVDRHDPEPRGGPFLPLSDRRNRSDVGLAGWRMRAADLRAEAARLTAEGARVTLFLLEPTPRAHKVVYADGGWWEQTGGLYGRSERTAPKLQAWRFRTRIAAEMRRIATERFENDPMVEFRSR